MPPGQPPGPVPQAQSWISVQTPSCSEQASPCPPGVQHGWVWTVASQGQHTLGAVQPTMQGQYSVLETHSSTGASEHEVTLEDASIASIATTMMVAK